MNVSRLKLCLIAPLVVVCCLAGVGSRMARAQSLPPTFQTGDVFVGIGSFTTAGNNPNGQVLWYRKDGTFVAALDTGQANTDTAGMAFDASGNLYATVFQAENVVKFDRNGNLLGTFGSGYGTRQNPNDPESILFDSAGNAYVGQADGSHQVLKFDSAGNPLAAFSPTIQFRGTDWIELAADQRTLYYTSEGSLVKRFDVSANLQLPDFATGLPGANAYALRILPNGQVLVADSDRVLLLDTSGNVAQTYLATSLEPGSTCTETTPCPVIFALTLDPDGKSFWTADLLAGTVWKVDIATGAIDLTINSGSNVVGGVLVFGEPTQTKQSVSLHLSPGATSTATAPFLTNGNPNDPASHAMKLTTNVVNPNGIDVLLTATYQPTEVDTDPIAGVGIADGICEVSQGATENTDFDCRLAAGGFVYQTLGNGDQVVPHCAPYHSNMCVWYRATTTATAQDEVPPGSPICSSTQGPPCYDYIGPVGEEMGWNTNVILANPSPNPEYAPGWNNQNERLYDRHGDDPDIAFKFDITAYFNVNCNISCVLPADQSGGGYTKHTNDWVWADVPNPPAGTAADAVEGLVPVPGISPFTYLSGLPMLVTFELEKAGTEITDPSALTKPHTVSVGTLDSNGKPIPVQFPKGFPTSFTFNKLFKVYSIFLSPAPYKLSDGTPNTVYTLQLGSDLFTQPVNATFKVCTLAQVLSHTCH
jgi:hypothetical protein